MIEEVCFVKLSYVSRFTWDEETAQRLRKLRGKISRDKLALEAGCSNTFIQNLEWANSRNKPESISKEDAFAICNALNIPIWKLFPTLVINSESLQEICQSLLT
ncbi:helix-turn-helix transcriptional regulator [Komarekiella sp. 'clone 1']|uniref:Helix-turn-helix transcriptional regulator n=1 Tax=Komarekiella delphini-convector SJRDD-AB1 TaxID=2593771 RepID=A0AA40VV13_9NOST|nr:helix-turn-helix transcriptional regulator [Komarekiella delphini-convector]MBD6620715.1 helix-turn-helix transcriptional regulator [Komarekiella delphini-convector SJRDD-AB1]